MMELAHNLWAAIQVVLLFGIVVVIHELGHFVFAKLFGVKVESFNIGFGSKRLWSKKIGETEYSIRPWPLGGFVQLHGRFSPEEMRELEGEKAGAKPADVPAKDSMHKRSLSEAAYDDVHALREKPFPVKVLVFGAGVAFNFLSVVLLIAIWYMAGREAAFVPPRLDRVAESSPLYAAGLRTHDLIVAVNGRPVSGDDEFVAELQRAARQSGATALTIERDWGSTATLTLTLPAEATSVALFAEAKFYLEPRIGLILPGKPAELAGLKEGDVVESFNGQAVVSWPDLVDKINSSPNRPIRLGLRDGTGFREVTVTPYAETQDGKEVGKIGIGPQIATRTVRLGPISAFAEAFEAAVYGPFGLVSQAAALGRLFGRLKIDEMRENLAGPVGILSMTFQSAKKGLPYLLDFFCLLSLALVIFNILPIPLLDGGHILQAFVEFVIRRPIPMKALVVFYNAALVFLLAFVLLVSANDFWRIGRGVARRMSPPASVQPASTPLPTSSPVPSPVP